VLYVCYDIDAINFGLQRSYAPFSGNVIMSFLKVFFIFLIVLPFTVQSKANVTFSSISNDAEYKEAEEAYLKKLIELVENIEDRSLVTYPVDVKAGTVTFYPVMRWNIEKEGVDNFFSSKLDGLKRANSTEDGIVVSKVALSQDAEDLVRDSYYIYYETEIGDALLRMPVLAPVKYKKSSASAFDTCLYGEIDSSSSYRKSLCLVSNMSSYGYVKKSAINKFEYRETFTNKPSFSVTDEAEAVIRVVIYKSDFTEVHSREFRKIIPAI